jgi:hypothetical protein
MIYSEAHSRKQRFRVLIWKDIDDDVCYLYRMMYFVDEPIC